MRNLLILLSILSSFHLFAALDSIDSTEWEESKEQVGQWYIEEEEGGPANNDQKAELDTTTRSMGPDMEPAKREKEAQQDEN